MSGCDNPACQQIQPPCLLDPGVARYITPPWVVRCPPPKNPSVLSDQSALFQQELPSSVTERFSTNIWCLSERGEGEKKKFGLKQSVRTILMEIADRRSVPASLRPQVSEQPVSCQNWPACGAETPALSTFPTGTFITSANLLPSPLLHKGQRGSERLRQWQRWPGFSERALAPSLKSSALSAPPASPSSSSVHPLQL